MAPIPPSVIGTAAPILADWYTHAQLNALFDSHGFPGDAPDGNKVEKCRLWLRHGNKELPDALTNFGHLIAEMMDSERVPPYRPPWDTSIVSRSFRRLHGRRAALGNPSRGLAKVFGWLA
jgi:hypothetical protein